MLPIYFRNTLYFFLFYNQYHFHCMQYLTGISNRDSYSVGDTITYFTGILPKKWITGREQSICYLVSRKLKSECNHYVTCIYFTEFMPITSK